jgi:tetratricopeptide (TPR) repeat protein
MTQAGESYSRAEAEKYIRDSSSAWAESVATNDASVVKRILADDVVWVREGKVLDKLRAVTVAQQGPGDVVSNHLDYANVRFFGDTAVVQGSETQTRKSGHFGAVPLYGYLGSTRRDLADRCGCGCDGEWRATVMAEGLIGGILGGEGEKPQVEAPEALANAEAFAAAVAARLSASDPEVARDTSAFLKKQTQLLETQNKHLEEEHSARLHYLRGQAREVDIRRFALRLRVGFQILLGLAVTLIGVGGLIMIHDALTDHGLVVEAFSVPPDMARDGLTGEVVATRFLDKLQAMQTATASDRPADSYQYNWGSDIKVEIPETGLELRALSKYLRNRFGHPNRITGEVIRTATGIAVTARFEDVPPATFNGVESDFDALAGKAAEAVYRTSQPYRFAQFLSGQNRNAEAFSVISDLANNGPPSERGWADIEWGMLDWSTIGDLDDARKRCLQGLGYSGSLTVPAQICLIGEEVWAGHDEKALEYSRPLAINAQKHAPGTTDEFFESNKIIAVAWLETLIGDNQKSAEDWTRAETAPFYTGTEKLAPALAATAYAVNHDPDSATAIVKTLAPSGDPSYLQLDATNAFYALPTYWVAAASGDWPAALADARACDTWLQEHALTNKILAHLRFVWIQPLEALAMARAGDVTGAETQISTTPLDCYLCVRVRAQIAATKRDWTGAERWYSEAVRQSPSLPFAFYEWGEMRLMKGDVEGAIAKFKSAHQKSPHFADALKGWGDALARQGQAKAALAKYDEALEYAPNWKELKEARGRAAAQKT